MVSNNFNLDYNQYEYINEKLGFDIQKDTEFKVGDIFLNLGYETTLYKNYNGEINPKIDLQKLSTNRFSSYLNNNLRESSEVTFPSEILVLKTTFDGTGKYVVYSGHRDYLENFFLNPENKIDVSGINIGSNSPGDYFNMVNSVDNRTLNLYNISNQYDFVEL
jgi:hypothetical protein